METFMEATLGDIFSCPQRILVFKCAGQTALFSCIMRSFYAPVIVLKIVERHSNTLFIYHINSFPIATREWNSKSP